jgi:hypothetical protein
MLLKNFSATKFAERKIEVCVFTAIDFEKVGVGDLHTSVPKKDKIFDCEVRTQFTLGLTGPARSIILSARGYDWLLSTT